MKTAEERSAQDALHVTFRVVRDECPAGAEDQFEPFADLNPLPIYVGELLVCGNPGSARGQAGCDRQLARIDRTRLRDGDALRCRDRQCQCPAPSSLYVEPQLQRLRWIVAASHSSFVSNVSHAQSMTVAAVRPKKVAENVTAADQQGPAMNWPSTSSGSASGSNPVLRGN